MTTPTHTSEGTHSARRMHRLPLAPLGQQHRATTPDPLLLLHRVDARTLPDQRTVHVPGPVEQRHPIAGQQPLRLRLIKPTGKPAPVPDEAAFEQRTQQARQHLQAQQQQARRALGKALAIALVPWLLLAALTGVVVLHG